MDPGPGCQKENTTHYQSTCSTSVVLNVTLIDFNAYIPLSVLSVSHVSVSQDGVVKGLTVRDERGRLRRASWFASPWCQLFREHIGVSHKTNHDNLC